MGGGGLVVDYEFRRWAGNTVCVRPGPGRAARVCRNGFRVMVTAVVEQCSNAVVCERDAVARRGAAARSGPTAAAFSASERQEAVDRLPAQCMPTPFELALSHLLVAIFDDPTADRIALSQEVGVGDLRLVGCQTHVVAGYDGGSLGGCGTGSPWWQTD